MASNEVEVLDPAATVEKLKKITSRRALNRRNFMAALGVTGAAAGAALVSGRNTARPSTVSAVGPSQNDYFNFLLNLEYLQATFYSWVTQFADLPIALTQGSGAVTGTPAAKLVFTGTNAQQITDMLNEIYYDELQHVINLRNLIPTLSPLVGEAPILRPAINLAAYATLTVDNALGIARILEDVTVSAYAGVAISLTGANVTYLAQLLAVESFHAGAIRLAIIQNPSIAGDFPTLDSGVTFAGTTTSGSAVITNVYYNSTTAITVGQIITGPGITGAGTTVVSISPAANTSITGTLTKSSTSITAVSSTTGLAVGQLITGTNITAGTTITAISGTTITISIAAAAAATAQALVVGAGTITLSAKAAASVTGQTYNVGDTDADDVAPADPGTAALSAAGPVPSAGFFDTAGTANAGVVTPAGMAFARTTSQVLAILYGAVGVPATVTTAKGGFFPSGVSGVITTI